MSKSKEVTSGKKKPRLVKDIPILAAHEEPLQETIKKLVAEEQALITQIKNLEASRNFAGVTESFASIGSEVDSQLSSLKTSLAISDKNLASSEVQTNLVRQKFELEKRNGILKKVLTELAPHQKVLETAEAYLRLEAESKALMHSLDDKLQKKEKHQKIGLNTLTTGMWKKIDEHVAAFRKEVKGIDQRLAEKFLPVAERHQLLEDKNRLLKNVLHFVNAEQLYLQTIYPERLSENEHLQNITVVLELYDKLKDRIKITNQLLATDPIAEGQLAVQQHQKFLQQALKTIEKIIEQTAGSLQHKQNHLLDPQIYSQVATAAVEMNEQRNLIEERCNYILDKVELIKKDTEIAQKIKDLELWNQQFQQVWGRMWQPIHGYAKDSLLAQQVQPVLFTEKGSPRFTFDAKDFQIKTPVSTLHVEYNAEERAQFRVEREELLQRLDAKKGELNQIYHQLNESIKVQKKLIEPLRGQLETYLKLANVFATVTKDSDPRFDATYKSYQQLYDALNFDFATNTHASKFANNFLNLANCRLYSTIIDESALANNLKDDIATFAKIKQQFQKDFPPVTLATDKTFTYETTNETTNETTKFPLNPQESLSKTMVQAVNQYSAARSKLLSLMEQGNDNKSNCAEELKILQQSQILIDNFVKGQQEEQIKRSEAERKQELERLDREAKAERLRQEQLRTTEAYQATIQKLEQHYELADHKITILNTLVSNLDTEIESIRKENPDDPRITLLTDLQVPFIHAKMSLAALKDNIGEAKGIQPAQDIETLKSQLKDAGSLLADFHKENKSTTEALETGVKTQLSSENLSRLTLSSSLLDSILHYIDKVIIPKLYKLVTHEEQIYKPAFFASKTEKTLFTFRKTIMPEVEEIIKKQDAAPAA